MDYFSVTVHPVVFVPYLDTSVKTGKIYMCNSIFKGSTLATTLLIISLALARGTFMTSNSHRHNPNKKKRIEQVEVLIGI